MMITAIERIDDVAKKQNVSLPNNMAQELAKEYARREREDEFQRYLWLWKETKKYK